MKKYYQVVTAFFLLNQHVEIFAQPTNAPAAFTLGIIENVYSVVLGEQRTLNIYLPQSYETDTAAVFPVIYLLDGSKDEDFIHIAGLVQFFTMIGKMEPTIVVGIANVDRRRDFTFPTSVEADLRDFPTTGGSEKFISFLETELQPFISSHYRTSGHKTIIGQSLGGLVATEILLRKPAMFSSYIIVSPSLWWDNESLLEEASALIQMQEDVTADVYLSIGSEGEQMKRNAENLADLLSKSTGAKFVVTYNPIPEEDHLTILHESVYRAFRKYKTSE